MLRVLSAQAVCARGTGPKTQECGSAGRQRRPRHEMGATASMLAGAAGELTDEEQRVLDYCSGGVDSDIVTAELGEDDCGGAEFRGVLVCDCLGSDLSLEAVKERLGAVRAVGLSLANNSINSSQLLEAQLLPWSDSLRLLNFGGNGLTAEALCLALPATVDLWSLDLGYSEGLSLLSNPGPSPWGGRCGSLLRLVLDGCGLDSTCVSAGGGSSSGSGGGGGGAGSSGKGQRPPARPSLFLGLPRLQQLSLRENLLGSPAALGGLAVLGSSLRRLALEDNPVVGTRAGLDGVVRLAAQHLPLLRSLDGRPLGGADAGADDADAGASASATAGAGAGTVAGVRLERAAGGSQAVGLGSGPGLDQMETEFLAALRQSAGQEGADATVVA